MQGLTPVPQCFLLLFAGFLSLPPGQLSLWASHLWAHVAHFLRYYIFLSFTSDLIALKARTNSSRTFASQSHNEGSVVDTVTLLDTLDAKVASLNNQVAGMVHDVSSVPSFFSFIFSWRVLFSSRLYVELLLKLKVCWTFAKCVWRLSNKSLRLSSKPLLRLPTSRIFWTQSSTR